jgi:hypothetical protein
MKKVILLFWLGLSLVWVPQADGAKEKVTPEATGMILIEPGLFKVSAAEQKNFAAALVLPGRPDEFRRVGQGPAVHCEFTEQPLEFQWHKAPQGAGPEKLAQGYGEMTIKYADDDMILQRYRGEFKNGFREGRGELLAREIYSDDAYVYRGEFRGGRLEGRGMYLSTDLRGGGEAPFVYEGEFHNDTFHGQGVMTDLNTGQVIHSGLWFEGFPFKESQVKWAKANRQAEAESRLASGPMTAGSAGE